MPDFDKNLNPILVNSSQDSIKLDNPSSNAPIFKSQDYFFDLKGDQEVHPIFGNVPIKTQMSPTVSAKELYDNRRYNNYSRDTIDLEDQNANAQSGWAQARNGVLKGTNLVATTIAGGFATLGGALASPFTGKLSTIWDNPGTRALDEWNNKVDNEYLPNYYSNKETNSKWYDTDNWMTSNFLFDKLIKNSGYAVGAMLGGNIINGVAGAAGAALGARALSLAEKASTSAKAFKIFTPLLKNTARAFSYGKNLEAAAILEKELSSIADLSAKSSKLLNIANQTNKFAGINDLGRKVVISTYSSAGEASFEALQTGNEFRENLIEKYKENNYGEEPTGTELANIEAQVSKVGLTSFLGNIALLAVTEFNQLPFLAGSSYNSSKRMANTLGGKIDDVIKKGDGFELKVPKTKFGKLYKSASNIGRYVFDPKEAGQEIGQYALQIGTQNYFNKAAEENSADIVTDFILYGLFGKDETGKDVGALVSKEGIEGGLLGGLTGAGMQAFSKIKAGRENTTNTQKFLESINEAPSFKQAFIDKMNYVNRATKLQQQYEQQVIDDDKLEAKDTEADLSFSYLMPRIKYGRFDLIMDDINDLKIQGGTEEGLAKLKEEGFANIDDTLESYSNRINEIKNNAENLEKIYESLNLRYSGQIVKDEEGNPILSPEGLTLRKYSDVVIDKLAYAASKIANYDVRIPQLNNNLALYGLDTYSVLSSIIESGKTNKKATEEVLKQIKKLDVNADVKDELKSELSDVIELSLRRKLFLDEYEDIKNSPLNYNYSSGYGSEENLDKSPVTIKQREEEDRRRSNEIQLELGKEYSLQEAFRKEGNELIFAPKLTVLQKTLGGEFEVKLPNGKIKFLTPAEFKNYTIEKDNNFDEDLADILNTAIDTSVKEFKEIDIPVETSLQDKLNFINSLDNEELANAIEKEYNKNSKELVAQKLEQKQQEEELSRKSEELKKQQDVLEVNSGTVDTTPKGENTIIGSDDKRKDVNIVFKSSTFPTGKIEKPHLKRAEKFLNNFKFFPQKDGENYRMIIVTPRNAESLGLKGIAHLSYGIENIEESLSDEITDVPNGFMAQVAVLDTEDGLFFIDENGNKIGKVKDTSINILDKVVFQTMTSASEITLGGNSKIRQGQESLVERELEAYKNWRASVESLGVKLFQFEISRGIRQETKLNGKRQDFPVSGLLGPKADKLISNEPLLTVVTNGTVSHNNESLSFPNGTVILKYKDLIDFANNKTLNKKQANVIYKLIENTINEILTQSKAKQAIVINPNYVSFLQNILFWNSKGTNKTNNQVGIDVSRMKFNLGTNSYSFNEISKNKEKIINDLQEVFFAVNNKTINKGLSERFNEYTLDKDGNLQTIEWKNYQSYLLSNKNPDKSSRSIEDIPLISHTNPATEDASSFKYKYSTLTDVEFVYPEVEQAPITSKPKTVEDLRAEELAEFNNKFEDISQFTTEGKIDKDKIVASENTEALDVYNKYDKLISPLLNNNISDVEAKKADIETLDITGVGKISYTSIKNENGKFVITLVEDEQFNNLANNDKVMGGLLNFVKTKKLSAPYDKLITLDLDKQLLPSEQIAFNKEVAKLFFKIKLGEQKVKEAKEAEPKLSPKQSNLSAFVFSEEEQNNSGISTEETDVDLSKIKNNNNNNFRIVGEEATDKMTPTDFETFKQWHSENIPNFPFEVLEKLINTHDNRQAWGVFEDGVIKFVKGGLKGTEYHEVFEAIYNSVLSSSEQEALLNEFKNTPGEFIDRETGKTILFSEATDLQAKERIADDFADFRLGKIKAKTLTEKIRNLFNKIIQFFKSFGSSPKLKDSLFNAIDTGKFKNTKPDNYIGSEYRVIEGLSEKLTNDFVQDIVATIKKIIFTESKKELLFSQEGLVAQEIFSSLRKQYQADGKIDAIGESRYNQLVERAKEYLRTIGVSFEEDNLSINNEEANKNDYAKETFSTDWKKNSTGAIKFLLSTLVERVPLNQRNTRELKFTDPDYSKSDVPGGFKLLNFSRAFATVMDRMHNTTTPKIFVDKLIQLAREDSNYVSLFTSLGGKLSSIDAEGNIKSPYMDFENFNSYDRRLFGQFYNVFTKQKPEALIQYISKEGEVYTSNANIFDAVNEEVDGWVNNMKNIAQKENQLLSYSKSKKEYSVNNEAISKLPIKTVSEKISFLNKLGITFSEIDYNSLSNKEIISRGKKSSQRDEFNKAVSSIYSFLGKNNDVVSFNSKTLDINGPLRALATLYVQSSNPNQDSTYFGVEGQQVGSFAENNAPSIFENDFNESKTLEELLEKRPELNDVFSKGSQILKPGGLFFNEEGERIAEIKVEYIQGTVNEIDEKNKATASLNEGDRYVQEINQNLNGKYYVIIPADGSTEWMMNLGNVISMSDVFSGNYVKKVNEIYNGYLVDEINLALENRTTNRNQKAKAQQLRFMQGILGKEISSEIENLIKEDYSFSEIQEYIKENQTKINEKISNFINTSTQELINKLLEMNKIVATENGYLLKNFDTAFLKENNLSGEITETQLKQLMSFVTINYEINNIEYHKFIFGDPYQFAEKNGNLDETKRIKSFLSPRGRIYNTSEDNAYLNRTYNQINGEELEQDTPGAHEYKPYVNTITLSDVKTIGSLAISGNKAFEEVNETDGFSIIMDNTYKEKQLKEFKWGDDAEAFHQWQMAYTRRAFDKRGIKKYQSETLREHDNNLLSSPLNNYKLAVQKPIVSGNKYGKNNIDLLLDKTSQMPMYYSMVEGTAMEEVYLKMFKQKIGYAIYESGRKVGIEETNNLYNTNGEINKEDFKNIIQVDWKTYGTQVETLSDGSEKFQTRGSQLTKMASMDLFENGKAINEDAQKAYDRNKKALDALNQNAYNELLNKLGLEELEDGTFVLPSGKAVSETLMYEMMRRDLSENIKDTIKLNEDEQFIIPFEASPSFSQIRNILYSLVNKAFISPKMSGAPHVQVPVTMFEKITEGKGIVLKTETGWRKITKKEFNTLSEEDKAKTRLTDDTLKFYEDVDGKRYCEIMLPNWFKNKIKKGKYANMSDEELLKYLNSVKGGKILEGIGFRIPTQAISSIEVFKVKGFLPDYMGYTAVVPSEITTKAGSDFDIDKLNMYLKSIYIDINGDIQLVELKNNEEETKEFYGKVFDEKINVNKENKEKLLLNVLKDVDTIDEILNNDDEDFEQLVMSKNKKLNDLLVEFDDVFDDVAEFLMEKAKNIRNNISELNNEDLQKELKERYVNKLYKQALENEYYDSLKELLTLPENFKRLVTPVDDAGLKDLAKDMDRMMGYNESAVPNRLINRTYLTSLRHAFITGKRWVGIAAVNITNFSLRQKALVYLDENKIATLPDNEKRYVKNLDLVLPHNKIFVNGRNVISLSGVKTEDGKQFISDRLSGYATAFVDIATNPFIMKLVKSNTLVSTFMFLESIGAGNKGIMFLNQPIVQEYIKYLDSINSQSVVNQKNIAYIASKFPTDNTELKKASISVDNLEKNIERFYKDKATFTADENAEQHLILDEFIKYKILADQLYSYTQATNYDTTRINNPDIFYKKDLLTEQAQNFNLISSVNDVLNNNFLGTQINLIEKTLNSYGQILKTETPEIKKYMLAVLKKYATQKYMSSTDFDKISNGIRNSFLDFVIQNNSGIKDMIKPLLVDVETAAVTKLQEAKLKYPNNALLRDLVETSSIRINGAKSIKLKVNIKSPYDENLYTGMMRELRDSNSELRELYRDIVNVAILQGSAKSAINLRNIIPVEDYSKVIAPIIQQLVPSSDLEVFENALYERNNFSSASGLFTEIKIPFMEFNYSEPTEDDEINVYKSSMLLQNNNILKLNETYNFIAATKEFIKLPKIIETSVRKEIFNPSKGEAELKSVKVKINLATGKEITPKDYAIMKQKGSFSLFDSFYYKKVYTEAVDDFGNKIPLQKLSQDDKGQIHNNFYYKLINVYGDGNRAVEYNTNFSPSVIDNGSVKIKTELTDEKVVALISPKKAVTKLETIEKTVAPVVEEQTESNEDKLIRLQKELEDAIYLNNELLDNSPEMIILNNLSKMNSESVKKETGLNIGNNSDINSNFISKTGKTVDEVANDIWSDSLISDESYDTQKIKDVIIDILSSGTKAAFIEKLPQQKLIKNLKAEISELKNNTKKSIIKEKKNPTSNQLSIFDLDINEQLNSEESEC